MTLQQEVASHPDFDNFIRAFWRRVNAYKNDYEAELPDKIPVAIKASMETALLALREVKINVQM